MDTLTYLQTLKQHNVKVVSTDWAIKAIEAERHQTHIMPPQRRFQTTEEHLHLREQTRLYVANTRVN